METSLTYEEQKQEILEIAEKRFGEEYFEQLGKLLQGYFKEEAPSYTIVVNNKGAFYACEE